jgi:hypothetical protein
VAFAKSYKKYKGNNSNLSAITNAYNDMKAQFNQINEEIK